MCLGRRLWFDVRVNRRNVSADAPLMKYEGICWVAARVRAFVLPSRCTLSRRRGAIICWLSSEFW